MILNIHSYNVISHKGKTRLSDQQRQVLKLKDFILLICHQHFSELWCEKRRENIKSYYNVGTFYYPGLLSNFESLGWIINLWLSLWGLTTPPDRTDTSNGRFTSWAVKGWRYFRSSLAWLVSEFLMAINRNLWIPVQAHIYPPRFHFLVCDSLTVCLSVPAALLIVTL